MRALSQSEESRAPARRRSVEGTQAASGNEVSVLFIVLMERRRLKEAPRCARGLDKDGESRRAHHVCKRSHAQAVGLDALVGQHVVHQHQFAVAEPDLPAFGLLCWSAVGPSWKARNRYCCKHNMRSQSAAANETHQTSASRRGTPCLPGRDWHIWPQPGEQQQQPAAATSS